LAVGTADYGRGAGIKIEIRTTVWAFQAGAHRFISFFTKSDFDPILSKAGKLG
jgi:hypothetical protein